MGFLAAQYFFAHQPEGLPMAQICIMSRASWSCRDDTAFLDRPKEWLALKCAVKARSRERHLPQLAKLELLVWNGSGFRLLLGPVRKGASIAGSPEPVCLVSPTRRDAVGIL